MHTQVNGTACAVPRMIVALLENYQQEVIIVLESVVIPISAYSSSVGRQRAATRGSASLHQSG